MKSTKRMLAESRKRARKIIAQQNRSLDMLAMKIILGTVAIDFCIAILLDVFYLK